MTQPCKLCQQPVVVAVGDYCSSDCRNEALVALLMEAFATDEEAAHLERRIVEEGLLSLDDFEINEGD